MKSAARLYAVQALFQMEASDQTVNDVSTQFIEHRFGAKLEEGQMAQGNVSHFKNLLFNAVTDQAKIDQLTDRVLAKNWPIDRIDPTIRAIFRAAGAELFLLRTPPKVVISEFVDVTKAFFPNGQESKFVNAVLDHMAREITPHAFS